MTYKLTTHRLYCSFFANIYTASTEFSHAVCNGGIRLHGICGFQDGVWVSYILAVTWPKETEDHKSDLPKCLNGSVMYLEPLINV